MEPQTLTFLLAMLPISELRGAMPLALTVFKLGATRAFLLSVLGNILIVPVIFIFLNFLQSEVFNKVSFFKKISDKIFLFLRKRYGSTNIKHLLGLTLFVAIPLPLTGAWTGSIVAFLLGIPLKLALIAVSAGVLIGGLIVFSVTKTGILLEQSFGWQALFLFLLTVAFLLIFLNKKAQNNGN